MSRLNEYTAGYAEQTEGKAHRRVVARLQNLLTTSAESILLLALVGEMNVELERVMMAMEEMILDLGLVLWQAWMSGTDVAQCWEKQ